MTEPCNSEPPTISAGVHVISAIVEAEQSGERNGQLRKLVNLPEAGLSASELGQLQQTVLEADDVFVLSDSELRCTSIVKHNIDTERHPPIKQHVRRTPFI